MNVTIVIADPQPITRCGLRVILQSQSDFSVVGEAADGLELVAAVKRERPQVAMFDLVLPALCGLDALRAIRERFRGTQALIISMCTNRAIIAQAFRNGAAGYLFKGCEEPELIKAVGEVAQGKQFLSPQLATTDLDAYLAEAESQPIDAHDTLTMREREVLQMVAEGHSSPEIASRLQLSHRTVENHRANLMRKLRFHNQSDLVLHAVRHGLIPLVRQ